MRLVREAHPRFGHIGDVVEDLLSPAERLGTALWRARNTRWAVAREALRRRGSIAAGGIVRAFEVIAHLVESILRRAAPPTLEVQLGLEARNTTLRLRVHFGTLPTSPQGMPRRYWAPSEGSLEPPCSISLR